MRLCLQHAHCIRLHRHITVKFFAGKKVSDRAADVKDVFPVMCFDSRKGGRRCIPAGISRIICISAAYNNRHPRLTTTDPASVLTRPMPASSAAFAATAQNSFRSGNVPSTITVPFPIFFAKETGLPTSVL